MSNRSLSIPPSCKVYTPEYLASAIIKALDPSPSASWLEPSSGTGRFIDALACNEIPRAAIRALDIESRKSSSDRNARMLRGVDFLEWAGKTRERFDRIVGNPPYASFEMLNATRRAIALAAPRPAPLEISNGSNYWYAFLCASITLLKRGGNLGLVLPSAWEYADYAKGLRSLLPKLFGEVITHRSNTPLFEEVSEGSVVLIARGCGQEPRESIRRVYENARDLAGGLVRRDATASSSKAWLCQDVTKPQLKDYVTIQIGAVCGDADFFLLSEEDRLTYGLPVSAMHPVVSRTRQIKISEITRTLWRELRDRNERVWLFRPSEAMQAHPAVRRYLDREHELGGCNRDAYKVRTRSPWYRVKLPLACHGFISGMPHGNPWLCINKMPRLTATNTLYTVTFKSGVKVADQYSIALAMQTSDFVGRLDHYGRRYADGLLKFEPSDFLRMTINRPLSRCGVREVYREVVGLLHAGRARSAASKADEWFNSSINARSAA